MAKRSSTLGIDCSFDAYLVGSATICVREISAKSSYKRVLAVFETDLVSQDGCFVLKSTNREIIAFSASALDITSDRTLKKAQMIGLEDDSRKIVSAWIIETEVLRSDIQCHHVQDLGDGKFVP